MNLGHRLCWHEGVNSLWVSTLILKENGWTLIANVALLVCITKEILNIARMPLGHSNAKLFL